jgi:RNA-binding protein
LLRAISGTLNNLLRSPSRGLTVLEIPTYSTVCADFRAPAGRNPASLATVIRRFQRSRIDAAQSHDTLYDQNPVQAMSSLSPSQKRYLRGLAHNLKPVILTGNKGVTPALLKEFSAALDQHELVKVKLGDDRDERKVHIAELGEAAGAELVQSIGRVACFYRRNEEKPKLALPR